MSERSKQRYAEAVELLKDRRLTYQVIAHKFGVSRQRIAQIAAEAGLSRRTEPYADVTPEMVVRIKASARLGTSRKWICRDENIAPSTLHTLIEQHKIKFKRVRTKAATPPKQRGFTAERVASDVRMAREGLAREIAAARAEMESGAAPPFKTADWG